MAPLRLRLLFFTQNRSVMGIFRWFWFLLFLSALRWSVQERGDIFLTVLYPMALFQINGALFQGSWAADYPMILVIAVDRLLSVVAPFHVEKFFDARSSLVRY